MIELEVRNLGGSEVLHACPQGKIDAALPCIIFYHGFTSSKLVYSYFAVALAQAGCRVVMPDASDHGARYCGDEAQRMQRFWPILVSNFHEFSALRDAIIREGWLADGRLAVGGASMGGMTALGLIARYGDIKCAASLMGSGYFTTLSRHLFPSPDCPAELSAWDAGTRPEKFADRPLLLWHGEEDDVVPAAESYRLQQALMQQGASTRLICQWQQGVRHRITPEALDATVAFFQHYL